MCSDDYLKFRIRTAEQNSKKGLDYEAKALLREFNKHKSQIEVWVDLFEDTFIIDWDNNHEINKYIQSKNIKKFSIAKLKTACESLFLNFLSSELQNLFICEKTIDGLLCFELQEKDKLLNHEYTLFLKSIESKSDAEFIKVNKTFNFNDLSVTTVNKLKDHLLKMIKHELENECTTKLKFEKLKASYLEEDVMMQLVIRFIDKLKIYVCNKENYEYIPLELNNNVDLKYEIFDEFAMRIRNKKDINPIDTTESMTKKEFFIKYDNKQFTKEEYDELLYKRLLGDISLNNYIGLKAEYIKIVGIDFFSILYTNLELIKNDLYLILKVHHDIIDKLFSMIYNTQNVDFAEENLIEIIKYKEKNHMEIDDISLKFLVYKMYETLEVYNEN